MRVDLLGGIPSSVSNSQIQRHSWVVLLSVMYSVSIVNNATVYHEMKPLLLNDIELSWKLHLLEHLF